MDTRHGGGEGRGGRGLMPTPLPLAVGRHAGSDRTE